MVGSIAFMLDDDSCLWYHLLAKAYYRHGPKCLPKIDVFDAHLALKSKPTFHTKLYQTL